MLARLAAVAVLLVSCQGASSGTSVATSAPVPNSPTSVLTAAPTPVQTAKPSTFTEVGRVLSGPDVGVPDQGPTPSNPAGYGVSDVSAIELPDGRIRIYFCTEGTSGPVSPIRSAISSDGIHFTVEPGQRAPSGCSPFIFRLPDGRYRLFRTSGVSSGVSSATGSDGLSFVDDPGTRVASNAFVNPPLARSFPVCSAIATLADGRYRMYCDQAVEAGAGTNTLGIRAIFSATSSDLLNWTPEPGRRIGPGAPLLTGDADHPTIVESRSNGAVTLVFDRALPGTPPIPLAFHEITATSNDGLSFNAEVDTSLAGSESAFVRRSSGSLLLYHGNAPGVSRQGVPGEGSSIGVAQVTLAP